MSEFGFLQSLRRERWQSLRNSDGVEIQLGGPRGTGGDTGLPPSQVYYCGRLMNQCRCGSCDGRCGPSNGCPCNSCRAFLLGQQQQQRQQPQSARTGTGTRLRNSDGVEIQLGGPRGSGGDTGLPPSQVYYCGRLMNQCRCGSCDGRCGPSNGCPCNSCRAFLLGQQQQQRQQPQSARTGTGTRLRNSDGVEIQLGGPRGTGGDTGLPPSQVYYCGRLMNQCRCGSCDGRCGPSNGCPCNSCRAFLLGQQQQQRQQQQQQKTPSIDSLASPVAVPPIPSSASKTPSSETPDCIICFERHKNATFIHGRTGHTCCCIECAEDILRRRLPCPICRQPISTVIENFTV